MLWTVESVVFARESVDRLLREFDLAHYQFAVEPRGDGWEVQLEYGRGGAYRVSRLRIDAGLLEQAERDPDARTRLLDLFRDRLEQEVGVVGPRAADGYDVDAGGDADTDAVGALPQPGADGVGRVLVGGVMTRDVEVVEQSTPVGDVCDLFAQHAIHHLPVVDGEQVVGLISSSDVLRLGTVLSQATALTRLCARDIMWVRPVVVREDSTLGEAAAVLCGGGFHGLPVVDSDRRLRGIVTSTDLLCLLANAYD